jgi:hypothetical protein
MDIDFTCHAHDLPVVEPADEKRRVEPANPDSPRPLNHLPTDRLPSEQAPGTNLAQFADNGCNLTEDQRADRLGLRAQLMPKRKVLDQIRNGMDTETGQFLRASRADPPNELYIRIEGRAGGHSVSRVADGDFCMGDSNSEAWGTTPAGPGPTVSAPSQGDIRATE